VVDQCVTNYMAVILAIFF